MGGTIGHGAGVRQCHVVPLVMPIGNDLQLVDELPLAAPVGRCGWAGRRTAATARDRGMHDLL